VSAPEKGKKYKDKRFHVDPPGPEDAGPYSSAGIIRIRFKGSVIATSQAL